jgi:DNA ligase-1
MKNKTEFAMLYKKTSTGAIQTWNVWVIGDTMYSESGQLNGAMTPSQDTIKEGKNIGKKNETTKEQQAVVEAQSRWTGKLKRGYVKSLKDAKAGKVDAIIEGGYEPMLANSYEEEDFPFAMQPKLDGIRCATTGSDTWSRRRKRIISVPHINKALEALYKGSEKLDGELYNHEFKDDFEKITHIVGQKKTPDPEHELVQYHIYDIPSEKPFIERNKDLVALFKKLPKNTPFRLVQTIIVNNEEEMVEAYDEFMAQRYEGAIIRRLNGAYEYKRSSNLLKMKDFVDSEFEIVGFEEGHGKYQNGLGAFVCITTEGNTFKVKMKGTVGRSKEYWANRESHKGQMLTVKYQGFTGKNKVPRFPVGKAIRDYE